MARYVALFRGINVGKAKRIAMADLRTLLEDLGYTDVATLLNSGNAVFSSGAAQPATLAARIRQAVHDELGIDALVIVKSAKDVAAIIDGNEILEHVTDASRLLVAVTLDVRGTKNLDALAHADWGREKLQVGNHAAYVWCAHGILESKVLGPVLDKLDGSGTTRNWATFGKIHALMRTPT